MTRVTLIFDNDDVADAFYEWMSIQDGPGVDPSQMDSIQGGCYDEPIWMDGDPVGGECDPEQCNWPLEKSKERVFPQQDARLTRKREETQSAEAG